VEHLRLPISNDVMDMEASIWKGEEDEDEDEDEEDKGEEDKGEEDEGEEDEDEEYAEFLASRVLSRTGAT